MTISLFLEIILSFPIDNADTNSIMAVTKGEKLLDNWGRPNFFSTKENHMTNFRDIISDELDKLEHEMDFISDNELYENYNREDAAAEDFYYEDDGQPTEYEEWQDVYGGDDWDHGQYDFHDYE